MAGPDWLCWLPWRKPQGITNAGHEANSEPKTKKPIMPPNQMIKEGQVNKPEEPKPLTPAEKEDKTVKQYATTFVLKHEDTGKPWLYLHVDLHGVLHVEFRGTRETFDGGFGTTVSDGLADAMVKGRAARTKKNARKKKT